MSVPQLREVAEGYHAGGAAVDGPIGQQTGVVNDGELLIAEWPSHG